MIDTLLMFVKCLRWGHFWEPGPAGAPDRCGRCGAKKDGPNLLSIIGGCLDRKPDLELPPAVFHSTPPKDTVCDYCGQLAEGYARVTIESPGRDTWFCHIPERDCFTLWRRMSARSMSLIDPPKPESAMPPLSATERMLAVVDAAARQGAYLTEIAVSAEDFKEICDAAMASASRAQPPVDPADPRFRTVIIGPWGMVRIVERAAPVRLPAD